MAKESSSALRHHVPALDGVRAVGMAAMLMYHGQVGSKGAFLALSQFFTLSGFLVMSILLRRLDDPKGFGVMTFWGRRYRRLMPASLLTLAAVILYGFTLATEQQVDALRSSIPAALAQVVNWHFVVTDASYVDLFSSPSPIQHFWSLAIEEQFYLLTPLLLLGIVKISRNPRVLVAGFAILAVGSTAWMYWMFEDGASIDRLYYGTDTRASEMLLGCLLAVVLYHWRPTLSPGTRRALGLGGLLAYALSIWAFFSITLTDPRMYRGGFLLFSTLTCIVIFSLVEETGPTHRVLGIAPLAALGRITYGVYLFHWPLMLALTEDRTGLDGWSLFALQVAVTIALAALSAKYFESPIRYGRAAAGDYRLPITIVATGALLALGGLALAWNDVETDLGGLGEVAGAAPPVQIDDGTPTRILVIADAAGAAFAANELAAAADDTGDATIVATHAFGCDPPADDDCAVWSTWESAIAAHDPDVVLFQVSQWDRADVEARSGTDDLDAMTDWTRDNLDTGFDRLTGSGATVVWGRSAATVEAALRSSTDPFSLAMNDLTSRRSDMRRLGAATDGQRTLDDLALYARQATGALPRVLVVGDSVSRTVGYGLERWTAAVGNAVTWSGGTEGCGIAQGGFLVDTSGRETPSPPACATVAAGWSEQIRQFDPDLVIVLSNGPDFRERRLDDWPERLEPGDPVFDDYLVGEYVRAHDLLSESGAVVTWVIPPCAIDAFGVFDEPDGGSALDDARIRYIRDEIISRVRTLRPQMQTFDLHAVICPDDVAITIAPGVDNLRPDGIHFSPPGSLWLAETHGDDLLARPES